MYLLVSIGLGVLVVVLWVRLRRTRQALGELEAAVRSERRVLVESAPRRLRRLGLEGLIREINGLIERTQRFSEENQGHSQQIEATLGSIQEAVLIFGADHVIQFANESAKRVFERGRMLRGARLESVVRSSSLLELLEEFRDYRRPDVRQIRLEQGREILWFEASCSRVHGAVAASDADSTLLVLHDITRLKALEVLRRDFVANVSHELRTPLTIIKGFAETLKEDGATLPAETRERFVDKIVNSAERLHVLVEDLLTLSRLESKPDQIRSEIYSLRRVFEETIENCRPRLDPAEQSMVLEFDARIEDFEFDRFRVQQVVDNLVENALRHATGFRRLILRAHLSGDGRYVECAVVDDGPGIPAKDLPHIFERFYRVDKGRSRERGGTGLGLSITKHIIQLHGGSVSARSELGKGSEMLFTLPYRLPQAAEADTGSAG